MREKCKVIRSHDWTTSAEQKNLGGNQEGDECKLSRMLYREQHLESERFSAGAETSDAARQEGLELCSGSRGFAEAKLLVRQQGV